MNTLRRAAAAALPLTLAAAQAMAASGGGGAMPYSPWITSFRSSMTGEVPLILGLVAMGGAVYGWVQSGDMVGLGHYLVRIAMASGFALGGAVALNAMAGAGGAISPEAAAFVTGGLL